MPRDKKVHKRVYVHDRWLSRILATQEAHHRGSFFLRGWVYRILLGSERSSWAIASHYRYSVTKTEANSNQYHYIRDAAASGKEEFVHCPAEDKGADVLSKPLDRVMFEKLVKSMGFKPIINWLVSSIEGVFTEVLILVHVEYDIITFANNFIDMIYTCIFNVAK